MKKLSKEHLKYSNDYKLENIKGCLYIIATPIGNFSDISLRAIQLFNFVDILLCEDTRKTKKLLSHLNINHKNMISYNDNNAAIKRPYVLKQLLLNKNIGLVSDAGTPLISDPGYKLVQECYLNNIKVTHAPGPSSVINGLILSGLPTNQFYFGGFVSTKMNTKIKQFTLTKSYPMTGVWFDTCLRLIDTLKIMLKIFGNRKISITRELTKIYEDVVSSDLENIESLIKERQLSNKPLKGEIVIIVNGFTKNYNINIETLKADIKKKLQKFSLRDTVNLTVDETNFSRKLIYNEAVKIKKLITEK
ncbi:16S rRNA (cytidine(1402)-2'-O)-methyltransferase [Alphaproteobacteria bacterium]|nr:16S rRNA (cytidine(1402)-2'-O)-methyltransferase [Alphaproteobacteria bacterium]